MLKRLNTGAVLDAIVWQKVAPLVMLQSVSEINLFILSIIILNVLTGGLLALTAVDLTALLIFRSIANNSWFLLALYNPAFSIFTFLFVVYSMGVRFTILFKSRFLVILGLLSLSGLPPFPLFFGKFVLIITLVFWSQEAYLLHIVVCFLLARIALTASYIRFISKYVSSRPGKSTP